MADFIDMFCGAGGASTGIVAAGHRVVVAINHDPEAIAAHSANHPGVVHLQHDIRKVRVDELMRLLEKLVEDLKKLAVWISSECTNFSNAKGGPRDADSRMLAEELVRFAAGIRPQWIFVENVKEFMKWGPLTPIRLGEKGWPGLEEEYRQNQWRIMEATAIGEEKEVQALLKLQGDIEEHLRLTMMYKDKDQRLQLEPYKPEEGLMYARWVQQMQALGYDYDWRMLNAADYGAFQMRDRYFGVFVRSGEGVIRWPKPTHSQRGNNGLTPWRACREILRLDVLGRSIFDPTRKRLVPATIARIRHGLNKYGGSSIDRTHTGASPTSLDNPMPTVRASFPNYLSRVELIDDATYGHPLYPVQGPLHALVASRRYKYLTRLELIDDYCYGSPLYPPHGPLHTAMASRDKYLTSAFLAYQYSSKGQVGSVDDPLWAVTTSNHAALTVPYLVTQFGASKSADVDAPLGAVTTNPKQSVVVVKYYGSDGKAHSIEEPIGTVTTHDRMGLATFVLAGDASQWPYTLRHAPAPTASGAIVIPAWCSIRNGYLVDNRIHDIFYRMLLREELMAAQGFPTDYILAKGDTAAKRQIGNAVHTGVAKALIEANLNDAPLPINYNTMKKQYRRVQGIYLPTMTINHGYAIYWEDDRGNDWHLPILLIGLGDTNYIVDGEVRKEISTVILLQKRLGQMHYAVGQGISEGEFEAEIRKVKNYEFVLETLKAMPGLGSNLPSATLVTPVTPPIPPTIFKTADGIPLESLGEAGKICAHCGNAFKPKRSDAQYCHVNCRMAANRSRAKTTPETMMQYE